MSTFCLPKSLEFGKSHILPGEMWEVSDSTPSCWGSGQCLWPGRRSEASRYCWREGAWEEVGVREGLPSTTATFTKSSAACGPLSVP